MRACKREESGSITQFCETASCAQSAIVAAFPQLGGKRAIRFDEGWDFWIYQLDSSWLFRFPKRRESVLKLEIECKLLPDLAGWLSPPTSIEA